MTYHQCDPERAPTAVTTDSVLDSDGHKQEQESSDLRPYNVTTRDELQENIAKLPAELRHKIWSFLGRGIEESIGQWPDSHSCGETLSRYINEHINSIEISDIRAMKDEEILEALSELHPMVGSWEYGDEYLQELLRGREIVLEIDIRDMRSPHTTLEREARDERNPLAHFTRLLPFLRRQNLIKCMSGFRVHIEDFSFLAEDDWNINDEFAENVDFILRGIFRTTRDFSRERLALSIGYQWPSDDETREVRYPLRNSAETRRHVSQRLMEIDQGISRDIAKSIKVQLAVHDSATSSEDGPGDSNRKGKHSMYDEYRIEAEGRFAGDRETLYGISLYSEYICDTIAALEEELGISNM